MDQIDLKSLKTANDAMTRLTIAWDKAQKGIDSFLREFQRIAQDIETNGSNFKRKAPHE